MSITSNIKNMWRHLWMTLKNQKFLEKLSEQRSLVGVMHEKEKQEPPRKIEKQFLWNIFLEWIELKNNFCDLFFFQNDIAKGPTWKYNQAPTYLNNLKIAAFCISFKNI